ncbi:uncharacterized protein [Palaemon carinicauda]|uniref:uncharacterized protein n=1 Tax=Palaemon carinicauda TaxID=392227 RepID=UPI0035B57DDC
MKWRERISILSRKRQQVRNGVVAAETSGSRTSASGTSYDARDDVEKTLSQIRPVIGPDHKSYYILLRGNEDSFTCIQPSKEVITSLDEVVKNVVSSVSQGRPQDDVALLPYARTSKNVEARSYKNASKKGPSENRKVSGMSSSVKKEIKITRTLDSRLEGNFLGTENVVENVVLHRRVHSKVNSGLNEVKKTSISGRTLVQSHSDPISKLLGPKRRDGYLCKTIKKSTNREATLELAANLERKLSKNRKLEHVEYENAQHLVQVNQDHLVQGKVEPVLRLREPSCPWKPESLVQMSKVFGSVNETITSKTGFQEDAKPLPEITLVAKGDHLLTDEVIAEQVKPLIESETLVKGEDSHVVLTRGKAQEVVLRILPKEFDESYFFENQQEEFEIDDLLHQPDNDFPYQEDILVMPDTTFPEERCYNAEVVDEILDKDIDHDDKSRFMMTSLSPSPHEVFQDPDVKHTDFQELLKNGHQDPLDISDFLQDTNPPAVEKIMINEVSLLNQSEGMVVIVRSEDGLTTQDGTPISDDLQYLIASLPDDQTYVLDGYGNHGFQSTKP